MNRWKISLTVLAASVCLTGILSACAPGGKGTSTLPFIASATVTPLPSSATPLPSATFTSTPTLTPAPVIYGPSNFPPNVNPLTGLVVSDLKILDRRPVTIKVANYPQVGRPHSGLSYADMVFEYYIGEGANRFLALYYGQDAPKVGPVRSGRLVDSQLVRMYQGILGFVSADVNLVLPSLFNNLGSRAISAAPATCPALCDDGRQIVISVFADTAALSKYAAEKRHIALIRPNLDGMSFDSRKPASGLQAKSVQVRFNYANIGEWRYDPTAGKYLRWIENMDANNKISLIPLVDNLTGKQLAFDNVIIVFAPYNEIVPTLHDILLWNNPTGRQAVVFRDGVAVEGQWRAQGTDQPMQFILSDGSALPLKPGNSWIVLAGMNSILKQPVLSQWEMQFNLP